MSTEREAVAAMIGDQIPSWVMGTVRFYETVADQLGIETTDLTAAGALFERPHTAGELAAHLGLTTGAATRVIDRLERRGYARRVRDSDDRRRVVVEMLPHAATRIYPMFDGMSAHLGSMLADYTDDQLTFLLEFVKRSIQVTSNEIERLRQEGKPHATRRNSSSTNAESASS